ncbi:hypothetical protein SLEP1_g54088 [Rubroshorea leprosula]|uniref:Uncharacterized protein n=1 Tax=Rubroshorea leprosula TaxID=152421 RepID=A0AAV5MBB7_9ROSI|nr:hypothetical protein SLEP1_g54088 [Rubroshorea leprosula]
MSLEETLSVRGSEELRALEHGDVGVVSESTRSKRTEENVGGSEVAEVKGEGVFENILEVGDRIDRCYDIGADIVFEACWSGGEGMLCTPRSLAAHVGSRKEKGWYYFTPWASNKEKRNLFSAGFSSIKGWKEKLFFVDDTKWVGREAEVEFLSAWKAKKANQNKYSLNSDENEEVGKLVREGGDTLNIMYLTSSDVIEVVELYGSSSLSEAEMDKFLATVSGMAIPKKPRKKSKISEKVVSEGGAKKELVSSTSVGALDVQARPKLKRKGSEDLEPPKNKKKKMGEQEVRGDEVVKFVPRPPPIELDPELRETEVRALCKGKELVPLPSLQSSLFDAKNTTAAWRFINSTFPEVDRRWATEEVLTHAGTTIVKHTLEKQLDEVVPAVTSLQDERDSLKTTFSFEERKRIICKRKIEAQEKEIKEIKKSATELKTNMKLLVHNAMERHIVEFLNSNTFENIVNLYQLPTTILAFIDCRKKVKCQYPKVDVTKITFGEQEEEVEEDDENMLTDFKPQIKLRWDHDEEGRTVFPPNFDFEFVVVEEGEVEVVGIEVEESQPPPIVEIHPVPSEEEWLAF